MKLEAPMKSFSYELFHITYYIYSPSPEECEKKNAIYLKLFRYYKVFVHWKLKLLNFLMDSVLYAISIKMGHCGIGMH